jgi:hypothetical protein
MSTSKRKNLMTMREISKKKDGYGIGQVTVQISSKNQFMNDNNAVQGKRILQEKIYSKGN